VRKKTIIVTNVGIEVAGSPINNDRSLNIDLIIKVVRDCNKSTTSTLRKMKIEKKISKRKISI